MQKLTPLVLRSGEEISRSSPMADGTLRRITADEREQTAAPNESGVLVRAEVIIAASVLISGLASWV